MNDASGLDSVAISEAEANESSEENPVVCTGEEAKSRMSVVGAAAVLGIEFSPVGELTSSSWKRNIEVIPSFDFSGFGELTARVGLGLMIAGSDCCP